MGINTIISSAPHLNRRKDKSLQFSSGTQGAPRKAEEWNTALSFDFLELSG